MVASTASEASLEKFTLGRFPNPTKKQRHSIRLYKMVIDRDIIYIDATDIKEMNQMLGAISRNINQIANKN